MLSSQAAVGLGLHDSAPLAAFFVELAYGVLCWRIYLEGRFDRLEGRFDRLEGRFDRLEGRFDKLEGRFDKFEGRFDKLETRFNEHDIRNEIEFANLHRALENCVSQQQFATAMRLSEDRFERMYALMVENNTRMMA